MFEQLFKKASVIARHRSAPYVDERARYLAHRAQLGDTIRELGYKARELIWVAPLLSSTSPQDLTIEQLEALASKYANGRQGKIDRIEERFVRNVRSWLRYLGWWAEPASIVIPFQDRLDAYCSWMRHERSLSEATIGSRRDLLKPFLRWYGRTNRCLRDLQPSDVDLYLIHVGSSGWHRISVKSVAAALRSFLRYGASQGWCGPNLANTVHGPTIYQQETLPAGPAWADIDRLLADMNTDRPLDIRDRAIVMLFAIYALRASEVAKLRVDDVDWEHERLLIHRTKRRQAQIYPLVPSVGNAIIRYLEEVRPRSPLREVFLGIQAPHRPLGPRTGLYKIVSKRLMPLGARTAHHGPHSLRHACANRLVAEGLSLKEIGDHLGHRSSESTRIYAKVDLAGLREIAAFDLGELS